MKTKIVTLLITGLLNASLFQGVVFASEKNMNQELIKRGEYLVGFGGCNDCHTPKVFTPKGPEPDPNKLLSGHPSTAKLPETPQGIIGPEKWGALTNNDLTAWVGPWGVSFAANLTPDNRTGLGGWTEEMFIKTMRTGKHLGVGREILPPMPWYTLAVLTDKDLKAIFAYLKSLKPIENGVPQPIPPQMQ
jgi:mono/diheme cytochrome c family protein